MKKALLLAVMAVVLVGCQSGDHSKGTDQAAQPTQEQSSVGTQPADQAAQPAAPAAPAAPAEQAAPATGTMSAPAAPAADSAAAPVAPAAPADATTQPATTTPVSN